MAPQTHTHSPTRLVGMSLSLAERLAQVEAECTQLRRVRQADDALLEVARQNAMMSPHSRLAAAVAESDKARGEP